MPSLIDMVRASVWRQPVADEPTVTNQTETPNNTDAAGTKPDAPPASPVITDTPREALKAAGVKFHHKTGDDKLAELLAAFNRSGLSGEAWNLLSDADRAQYYESE